MMSDPKLDHERMKIEWEANILPVPSAERLKGKGSSPASCSAWLLQAKDPFKGWETWGEVQTEAEAKAWKKRKEMEPVIYCKMKYRIIEPNIKHNRNK